jgi:hypothetical protein
MHSHHSVRWIQEEDRRRFDTDGYMVIRNMISVEMTRNAVREIAEFLHADLSDSTTWYGSDPRLDGLVPLHHAQSLWDIRQSSDLYCLFAEFFETGNLMLDINRCLFRAPVNPAFPTLSHGNIHWDTDPRVCGPGSLQAVVLLTDVGRNSGGFQCIPDIYKNLHSWLQTNANSEDFDFFNPGLNDYPATQVEGKAGDVILWSTRLPHGSAANLSTLPRVAMFVTMQPPTESQQYRESMKTWWQTRRAPDHWRGLPGQLDPEPGEPAALSTLGMKLIGLQPW